MFSFCEDVRHFYNFISYTCGCTVNSDRDYANELTTLGFSYIYTMITIELAKRRSDGVETIRINKEGMPLSTKIIN